MSKMREQACDEVATLFHLAGKRETVPGACARRVHAAARVQWESVVRGRAHRRFLRSAAGLAVAASLLLGLTAVVRFSARETSVPRDISAAYRVEAITGPSGRQANWRTSDSPARHLGVGDDLTPGVEVATLAEGRLALRLASGHSLRLDHATTIRLLDPRNVVLERGAIYLDSGASAGRDALAVHTPLGVVREIGTQFEVRLVADRVRVRLREGRVSIEHADRNHRLSAGTELELDVHGEPRQRAIATHDPAWAWTATVAPMPDLAGRSAREFLDWVSRERGWTVTFADDAVARAADAIVLRGTVDGLTLDEALDAVLPACRLTYRVDEGVLSVASARDPVATER